ncbi:MAG: tRNA guanosine(34) transglycosylase Tgt [Acidobacteria bacterium]|nr:tRNA guanosine(34) transglycosylase Tgt [Acidobacteriota bacterium]
MPASPASRGARAAAPAARCGRLITAHGAVETPAFMPVGTLGAVKGVTPQELAAAGAPVLLANLYHLALRPGIDTIERLGGLHRFTGWHGPLATDSGGFQVWSLGHLRSVDDGGVTFRSHLDGSTWRFTPEAVVDWQQRLGVDVAMTLDECLPWPVGREQAAASWQRTLSWARQARAAWRGTAGGGLFGIVQGSVFPDLRQRAARELAALDFDGYAIGGVSVGEPAAERRAVVEHTAAALPPERPRYLMGVGYPADMLHAAMHGVDLFDCVLPARNARHGVVFTREGVLKIRHARFRGDPRPLDPECGCPCCTRLSRAFLHHLMRAGELTGPVLATLHNLRYYLDFMAQLRQAIALGALADLAARLACFPAGPAGRPPEQSAGRHRPEVIRGHRPGAGSPSPRSPSAEEP